METIAEVLAFLAAGGILGVVILVVVAAIFGLWLSQRKNDDLDLAKRLTQPATKISDWHTGWRCPSCNKWTGYQQFHLGAVVCMTCGSAASDYERVKYRAILKLDERGYYKFDREIDMSAVVMQSGECDYCGKKPCGCGATHNWLDVFEEVESA